MVTPESVRDHMKIPTNKWDDDSAALMQTFIDAVNAHLESFYDVPATPTSDFDMAVIMETARLWLRRDTPEGIAQFGDLGVIRVNGFDRHTENLLAPYKRWVIG